MTFRIGPLFRKLDAQARAKAAVRAESAVRSPVVVPPFNAPLHREIAARRRLIRKRQRVPRLLNEVAERYGVPVQRIKYGGGRKHHVVVARQEAMFLLRRHFSLHQIGRLLGGFDHTTCLHGARAHAERNNLPVPP